MKEKFKRISKSSWALILAVLMLVSSFSVLAATTNVSKTGAYNGTVYFQKDGYTGDVYIYTWDSNNKTGLGSWPGTKMKSLRDGLYSYDLSNNTCDNVIFNNDSGTQTDNLTFPIDGNNMYKAGTDGFKGEWTTYATPVASNVSLSADAGTKYAGGTVTLTATATTDITTSDLTYTFKDSVGSKTVTKTGGKSAEAQFTDLTADTHKFTVTVSKDGYSDVTSSEVTVNVEAIPTNKWYIYGGLAGDHWDNPLEFKDYPMTWSTTDNAYVSVNVFDKPTDKNYFRLHNGVNIFGPTSTSVDVAITSTKSAKLVNGSQTKAFEVNTSITGKYYLCTDGSFVWYKLAQQDVADSVSITPATATKNTGDSIELGANVTGEKVDNLTYTFNRVSKDGTVEETLYEGTNSTYTVTNLSKGIFYYTVTVSADGYSSVTSEKNTVTVTTPKVADSVSLSADNTAKNVGDDVTLIATVANPKTTSLTYTFYEGNNKLHEGTDATYTVKNLKKDDHTYKVVVSADNYIEVPSEEITVKVSQVNVAESVSLLADPTKVNVGDSATLTATANNPISGTLTYTLKKDGTKIDETTSDNGKAEFTVSDFSEEKDYNYTVTVSVANDTIGKYVSKDSNIATVNATKNPAATSISFDADVKTSYTYGETVTLSATATGKQSGELTYKFTDNNGHEKTDTSSTGKATVSFDNLNAGEYSFTVSVYKDGKYTAVTSDPITVKVNKKTVAKSVTLSASAKEVYVGESVTLTANVDTPSTESLTYKFTDTTETTKTEKPSTDGTATFDNLTKGTHTFKVEVSAGDNYTTVTSENVTVNVVNAPHKLYLVGDFAGANHWNDETTYTDYPFEYSNGKYILKNVPFTGAIGGDKDYSFFRIYDSTDKKKYSSTSDDDQLLENGKTASVGENNNKALKFPSGTNKKVNIEFDLDNLKITVTEVVEKYTINAKYQITDNGTTYQDAVVDKAVASINDEETVSASSGSLKAVKSFEKDGSTYVFSKWVSTKDGTFTSATSNATTFNATADTDVVAQYKKQLKITCTTPTNGKLTTSVTAPLVGDTYTITVTAEDGYELTSLMRYVGTPETSGEDVTASVSNGTYTATANDNARYVAVFSKKKIDYSKIRIVGKFDDFNNWSNWDNALQFDENGECTVTITTRSSGSMGGNGQFRFMDSDKNYYGVNSNEDLQMNKEYTPIKEKTSVYYLYSADVGTFKISITKIASDGTPSFKVTKDTSTSTYELMSSTSQTTSGTSLGHFKTTDNTRVVSMTKSLAEGTYNFYVSNGGKNYCSKQTGLLGENYGMNRIYDSNVNCVQYKLSAGLYTISYTIESDTYGVLRIDSVSKPLAKSVTLTAAQTSVTVNKSTTLTATVNDTELQSGDTYTYTYYDSNGNQVGQKNSKSATDSITVTSDKTGPITYYVTVSTNATYEDPAYEGTTLTYTDVTSEGVSVTYVEKSLYIAEVKGTTIGDRYQLTQESFFPKSSPVTLAFFNEQFDITEDTVEELTVDTSKNKYCQIVSSSIDDSAVSGGIPTYKVICNEGAENPVVYVKNGHIYAVASLVSGATSKTFDNTGMVTYYFAKLTSNTASKPNSGSDGVRIKYWNNSVPTQNGFVDVTTPAGADGKETTQGNNKIYVRNTDLKGGDGWPGWNGKIQEYYVYKVDLPVWATSFQFANGDNTITTDNGVVQDKSLASMGLNPNRIYLLFDYGYVNYSRGVVLDSSFWTNNTRDDNSVETKNFKTNAVNYATSYGGSSISNKFNENLNKLYSSTYSNPLFFGYIGPDTKNYVGNNNFRIQDNLAMRINENAYYASVQGLAGSKLSDSKTNKNGYAYLQTSDNAGTMPLFDYDALKKNSDVAANVYEQLNFPFNESSYNGITTYSYDSYTDKNRAIDTSTNDFKVDKYSTAPVGSDNGVGFFPFDNFSNTGNQNKYGFGTEFDIDFYMSETGRLTAADDSQKDITFNFSGDDDVWVYVDGVLVLDLGGAHKASSGSINFSTMEVIYKAAVDSSDNINSRSSSPKTSDPCAVDSNYVTTVDLAQLFAANGVEFNNTSSSKKHTLQMFYMERGCIDSNCSISFNLPQNTGLLVRNDVNFDSVNDALKDITRGVANKDYFSYSISNKLATDAEYSSLKTTFGDGNVPEPAKSFESSSFVENKPLYPISTSNNIIRRVVNGKTYYLAVKNSEDGSKSTNYWGSLTNNTYLPLTSINYNLPDDFASIENSSTANAADGTTAVSGRVTNGGFNLLFNQSASFDSKTPSNTLLRVAQNDELYNVNAGSSTEAMSVGDKQTDRTVKDYYVTSYTITDDKSQKVIGSRERSINKGAVVADDSSAVENAFYFADYSENKSDSSAMTVNFTNYVATNNIKITKDLTDSTKINGDHFTFIVQLSNIFGDSSYEPQEYEALTYNVYDRQTNQLKSSRTYGKSGVSITADEYAIISGIPVGTKYTVSEKTRSGYEFDDVSANFTTDDKANSSEFDPQISSSTVSGTFPTITASGSSAVPTLELAYTNKKVAFTISFKYYDREVKTGEVAHIATTPTIKNYSFDSLDKYKKGSEAEGYYYDFEEMIADAMGNISPDNVIDSYVAYTSQSAAIKGIKNQLSYRNFDETTSSYQTYADAYPNGNFDAHTDYYGRLQGSDKAQVNDGESWVTYYNGNRKFATEEAALGDTSSVTSITVWYFNTLKTYSPTFVGATQASELDQINGTEKYVGTNVNTIKPVFYNVRLGLSNEDAKIDAAGTYLEEYDVAGYTNSYSGSAMSIADGSTELKFLYWSYDKDGKSIASNSYKYGYRITNNIKLYAIYGDKKDNTDPGLTVSMNSPDYYTDTNGINRVRLNTMMNVYNCPDSDKKIRQTAVIYLQDPNNYISNYIASGNEDALKNIREKVQKLITEQSANSQFSGITIKIDGTNDNLAKGLTYKVWSDDGTSLLTNKNRMQFTTSFRQSSLGGDAYKNLYTFAAMNYKDSDNAKDNWLVSDNYIKYTFNANGKVTNSMTQVNSLQ